MGNTISSQAVVSGSQQPIYERQTFPRSEKKLVPKAASHSTTTIDTRNHRSAAAETASNANNQENSRMLFLMYLINRTWNVVVKR